MMGISKLFLSHDDNDDVVDNDNDDAAAADDDDDVDDINENTSYTNSNHLNPYVEITNDWCCHTAELTAQKKLSFQYYHIAQCFTYQMTLD